MGVRHYLRHLDYVLLATTLALVGYGVMLIYVATRDDPISSPTYYVRYQMLYASIGIVALVAVTLFDYEALRRWQWAFYGLTVGSIAVVYVLGPMIRGSRRWIDLGFINLQPSELAIWLMAIGLAAFLVDRLDLLGEWRLTLMALAYAAFPAIMVLAQPDLGTATVLFILGLALLFFFGTPWTHLVAIGAGVSAAVVVALTVLPAMGLHVVKSYQLDRLMQFLHPGSNATTAGYNVRQSIIAVGSGGFTGRGSGATQTSGQFLPEHHTDFIFAVAGERWGFVGAAVLVLLYAVLVWRALRIATIARDMYGSVIAGGIATVFLYQALVNMGMTIGIMPVTGIPLPFVSYGGAALITGLMLVGLLESIHMRSSHALVARERVG